MGVIRLGIAMHATPTRGTTPGTTIGLTHGTTRGEIPSTTIIEDLHGTLVGARGAGTWAGGTRLGTVATTGAIAMASGMDTTGDHAIDTTTLTAVATTADPKTTTPMADALANPMERLTIEDDVPTISLPATARLRAI